MSQHPILHMDAESAVAELASLRALAGRLVADPHEAEDVAYAALQATAARGGRVKNPRGYARGVVRIQALRRRREASHRRYHEERRAAEVPEAAQSSPDEALQRVELMRIVLEEIGRLPAAQSRAIALRYVEQRSVEQIAQIEHKQPSTIRAHISRGLAGVRESLDRRLGGRSSWSLVLAPWALDPNFLAPVEGLAGGGGAATTSAAATGSALTALTALKLALILLPLAALAFWFAIPGDAEDAASDAVEDVVAAAALAQAAEESDGPDLAEPDLASTTRTAGSTLGPASTGPAAPAEFPFRGRVLNAAGAGARGVTVLVDDPASAAAAGTGAPGGIAPSAYEAETGPDGAFELDVMLPAGPLAIRFEDTASGLPLESAPEPVTFPFEGALETTIPPAVELRFRGARLPEGSRVFAVPRQPVASRAAVSKGADRFVRFIDPVSADARWIEFEVRDSYLAASAPIAAGPDRFEDPLVVRFEARGRVQFRMEGLDPAMQAFVFLKPVEPGARTVIARFDDEGVGLADDLVPGDYRWSCRLGSVEQSGDVAVAARATAVVELQTIATAGRDASVLIDASAAPEADLLDGQWSALAVDAGNPASGLSVEITRRGAPGDGLWHAQIADLPEGDWLLGLRPGDGYIVASNLAPIRAGETTGPIVVTPASAAARATLRVVDAESGELLPSARLWIFDGIMGASPDGEDGLFEDVVLTGSADASVFAQADGHALVRFSLDAEDAGEQISLALPPGRRTRVFVIDMARQAGAEGVEVVIDGQRAGLTDERGELWFEPEDAPKSIVVGGDQAGLEVLIDPFELGMGDTLMTPGYVFVVRRD